VECPAAQAEGRAGAKKVVPKANCDKIKDQIIAKEK
jgi:hypothetical protein